MLITIISGIFGAILMFLGFKNKLDRENKKAAAKIKTNQDEVRDATSKMSDTELDDSITKHIKE